MEISTLEKYPVPDTASSSSGPIEAWELERMVPARVTMQKDKREWRSQRGLGGIKVLFFSALASSLWSRIEGCHGDEVGPSPTVWCGKSTSLLWHLLRSKGTDTTVEKNASTYTEWREKQLAWSKWQTPVRSHIQNWLSQYFGPPTSFALIFISPVSQHIFPSTSHSLPNSCTQPGVATYTKFTNKHKKR